MSNSAKRASLLKACRQTWRGFSSPVHRSVSHGYPAPPCNNNSCLRGYPLPLHSSKTIQSFSYIYIYNIPIIHLFSGLSTMCTKSLSTQFIYIYIYTRRRCHARTHNYTSIRNYNWRSFGQRAMEVSVMTRRTKQCRGPESGTSEIIVGADFSGW